jgi:hypothetical protein
MPRTYPIHPGDRLQRRIVSVLSTDLLGLSAFTGFSVVNDRSGTEQDIPMLAVRVGETVNQPPASHVWHVTVTVVMVEDRQEGNLTITGDSRPRHELRTENLSARLFGAWNGSTLDQSLNAISNGQGVYVLKLYGQNVTQSGEEDTLGTEYTFTAICVSTEQ